MHSCIYLTQDFISYNTEFANFIFLFIIFSKIIMIMLFWWISQIISEMWHDSCIRIMDISSNSDSWIQILSWKIMQFLIHHNIPAIHELPINYTRLKYAGISNNVTQFKKFGLEVSFFCKSLRILTIIVSAGRNWWKAVFFSDFRNRTRGGSVSRFHIRLRSSLCSEFHS